MKPIFLIMHEAKMESLKKDTTTRWVLVMLIVWAVLVFTS